MDASLVVSILALVVSVATAWLTFFRTGQLKMTQPTVVFFGPDDAADLTSRKTRNKVFLRTLLYSTARRGQTVESLYVNLQRGESKQNFSIWVYGQRGELVRGSGVFVPMDGLATNHHFMLPMDGGEFPFFSGDYTLRLFAKRVGAPAELLTKINLHVSEIHAQQLNENQNAGLYFDWGPDQRSYHAHVDVKRSGPQASLQALEELALGRERD